ncbi:MULTISPECIES: hypothetical protein [Nocardioides]|uniref:Uncharacterized protein n=1 Tax=Nocardioides lianchengensis TaxID=1045774 RepID=A0A1G6M0W4_9ACTN|nr:hypothetical protein [Nocardioides lianchengensis]NYG12398.1 hypothetical protein [Nocardioides lianchengensis]SDC48635.1 hypothetical protein SAMN05421872_102406 [Nocardioides lianchengensis]
MSEHQHDHDHSDHDHGDDGPSDDLVRRAGHIILDGVTAADVDNEDAMELAFGRLLEIDAIEVTMDEDEGELELDISPLMSGVLLVVTELVNEIAERDGSSPEDVLARIRTRIDG